VSDVDLILVVPDAATDEDMGRLRSEPRRIVVAGAIRSTGAGILKRSLGSYAAAGQLQQRPSPAGGGLIKRHWFRYWQPRGSKLPPVSVRLPDGTVTLIAAVQLPHRVDEQIQSWDCAFKDLNTSDYVVGQAWARLGAAFFLGDQTRARMDCPTTVRAVRELTQRFPGTLAKLIEDKANGSAVIQMLAKDIPGLLPVTPQGGKVARAAAVSPLIEAGNIYPPPGLRPVGQRLHRGMRRLPERGPRRPGRRNDPGPASLAHVSAAERRVPIRAVPNQPDLTSLCVAMAHHGENARVQR
jgi:predicted phage terminase large subunit-like protein